MTEHRETTTDATALAWLTASLGRPQPGPGHLVSELLPAGYQAYVRIFHRFESWDRATAGPSWREWAERSGVPYVGELSHRWLKDGLETVDEDGVELTTVRWVAEDGALDAASRRALVALLGPVTRDQPVHYAYRHAAAVNGLPGPLLRTAPLAALEALREELTAAVGESGPEHWWPEDRSWVVATDYDLLSSYVACTAATAALLLADPTLEAIEVTPHTRIDWDTEVPAAQAP
ncbi:hypothetical protein ACIRBX_18945 [Kitasatospora sp. NPDC096147]|uniref:hypothetical protein n=1 Tax=Kitasatospora sp. NPDC096147 TaxID=3364093 RepID=UPI0038111853